MGLLKTDEVVPLPWMSGTDGVETYVPQVG